MKDFVLFVSAVVALGSVAVAPDLHAAEKLVFALKPDKNPDQMLAEKESLETYLSGEMGCPVEVIIPLTASVILEGFVNGSVDAGYLSGSDMVNAREKEAASILLAGEIDGNPFYQSYWVSLKDKPYGSVEDLRGQPVAFSSRTSTSGFVVPLWDLHQKGLIAGPDPESFFGKGNVFYGTGYVSAVERVLRGEAEAAAVSYYVLDKDKHLSETQRAELKMVASQGPVPTHVIAVRNALNPAQRAALQAALEKMNLAEHSVLRDKLFTSKLIKVDAEAHLAGLAKAFEFVKSAR